MAHLFRSWDRKAKSMLKDLTYLMFLLTLFSCNRPTERMEGYEVHGIDISHHQQSIDWTQVALQNIDFAFIKATEGADHQDSLFCVNWPAIKLNQIKRGAYHFFRPATNPDQQFLNFATYVDLEPGDLAPVLDVEVTDGVSEETLRENVRRWLQLAEVHYQVKPILYTNQKFYNRHFAGHFDDYTLWIARYNPWFSPWLKGKNNWAFWQYGNRGSLPGIQGDVDFNVFTGSLQELESCCLLPDKNLVSDPHPDPEISGVSAP